MLLPSTEAVVADDLVAALDGPERLCVLRDLRDPSSVLAHWVARADHANTAIVWIDGESASSTAAAFWLRALTQAHARGLLPDAVLYREIIGLSEAPDMAVAALTRVLREVDRPVTLVVSGFPRDTTVSDRIAVDLLDVLGRLPTMRCVVATSSATALETRGASVSRRTIVQQDFAPTASALVTTPLEVAERMGEPGLSQLVAELALAPAVDAALIADVTGRSDAEALLRRLEHAGAGHRGEAGDGTLLFRFRTAVRERALADVGERDPRRLAELRRVIARWLFDELKDDISALEYALEARDLEFAAHVALRAFPFRREEGSRVVTLLRRVPAVQIHRHPLLALWYGLVLNAEPATQRRAPEFFASAAVMSRVQARSIGPLETAVHRGLESLVWRMLGQERRMAEAARRCVELLDGLPTDPRLAEIVGTVLYQSAISALRARDHSTARRAFALLVEFSERHEFRHRRNAALAGLALLETLEGRVHAARRSLAAIVDADWPQTWRDGYMGAPARIARAWSMIDDADPAAALAELDVLDPHLETIEHWDLILTPRVIAKTMLGRRQEAAHRFQRTSSTRVRRSTLPAARERVAVTGVLLDLLTGTAPAPPRGTRRPSSLLRTVLALQSSSHDPLAAAGRTPIEEMLAAIADVRRALRRGEANAAHEAGARIAATVAEHGLRWPLQLMTAADRERILALLVAADEHGTAEVLRAGFDAFDPRSEPAAEDHAHPVLSPREAIVLQALAETASRAEIADRLFVSVNTVKAQLRSLYRKLGVTTRDDALARAAILRLLDPPEVR